MTLGNGNNSGRIPRNNYKGKYVTHTSTTLNKYPKPKPPDIQFKERELEIITVYTADVLNIYDLSDYEILNILHKIMMIVNVYKSANISDYQVSNHSV
jgi:hypothetical protein